MFAKYHYLSHNINNAAKCFVATINGVLAAFICFLHFPHSRVKNFKQISRLVVLPDYQGIGIGIRLLNTIAQMNLNNNQRTIITTTNPALIFSLKKSNQWKLTRTGRTGRTGIKSLDKSISGSSRITTAWEYNCGKTAINGK